MRHDRASSGEVLDIETPKPGASAAVSVERPSPFMAGKTAAAAGVFVYDPPN
jgi:hypothetical protein